MKKKEYLILIQGKNCGKRMANKHNVFLRVALLHFHLI